MYLKKELFEPLGIMANHFCLRTEPTEEEIVDFIVAVIRIYDSNKKHVEKSNAYIMERRKEDPDYARPEREHRKGGK